MFEGLWGRKFYTKCKSGIKSTTSRIEMVRRRRKAMQNFLTHDIADLLRRGLDTNAYQKANELCGELNQISCLDFIDQFCGCILDNLSAMHKARECPKECKEAVSSISFAAARMADVPELKELRNTLTEKYGNSLESFVNQEFAEKLKSRSSSSLKDTKLQLLRDIAQESSIEWDSKALEQKLFNPHASDKDKKNEISPKREDIAKKEDGKEDQRDDGVGNGFRLHFGWRNSVPEETNQGAVYSHGTPPSIPPRENSGGGHHQDLTSSERRAPEKERGEKQPFFKRIVPPPYTRSQPGKDQTSPDEIPNAQASEGGGTKGKTLSVRTRQLKPPPGRDQGVEQVKTNPRRTRVEEDPRRGLQILSTMDSGQKDEEVELDRLLVYYSSKKPAGEPQTAEENPCSPPSNRPSRAISLPLESVSPSPPPPPNEEETRKRGHVRANSASHVHPKLPDYDEIAARLAALRG